MYYLVKWASQPSEYNSYEPASYLANALKAIVDFKRKRKRIETKAVDNNEDEVTNLKDALTP